MHLTQRVYKKNRKITKYLFQGHPVTVYDTAGWAPIHEAANYGYVEIIQFLLDHKANVNEQGNLSSMDCQGITPLIDSCINGHLTAIELLLDRGAKVELKMTKPPVGVFFS
jgi:ankyrin repeat protein